MAAAEVLGQEAIVAQCSEILGPGCVFVLLGKNSLVSLRQHAVKKRNKQWKEANKQKWKEK